MQHFNERTDKDDPIDCAVAITPDDVVDLEYVTRVIWVGTAGNLSCVMNDGKEILFLNLQVGWHPIRIKRVNATGTTASGIVGGW